MTTKSMARSAIDTGSSEVQIARLTDKINKLTVHFQKHKQDKHSQRGLMRMVVQRKKLLNYIKQKSPETYQKTISQLSLRK